jgi:hypothetical protein
MEDDHLPAPGFAETEDILVDKEAIAIKIACVQE